MKKILVVNLLIVFSFLFFSCTNKTSAENEKTTENKDNKGIEHLTIETFKQKVHNFEKNKDWKFEGDLPVIIDFYADWCRPCKMVAPILEELSKDFDGKIRVYKIDTQKEQELASMFGITGIPAFLFIPKEGQPSMATGYMDKEAFVKAIKDVLLVK